jgi:hypothetical protein
MFLQHERNTKRTEINFETASSSSDSSPTSKLVQPETHFSACAAIEEKSRFGPRKVRTKKSAAANSLPVTSRDVDSTKGRVLVTSSIYFFTGVVDSLASDLRAAVTSEQHYKKSFFDVKKKICFSCFFPPFSSKV